MRAAKLLLTTAFAGLASLGLAGPGPEYWARMNATQKKPSAYPSIWRIKDNGETKAKPTAEVAASCTACSGCQTKKS